MMWLVPPECQGQMIEYSYAADHDGKIYMREFDLSARSVNYYSASIDDCGCDYDCDCFDPINHEPAGYFWEECSEPKG